MAKTKKAVFHEYRYQILPTSQHIQMDLEGEITSVDDLKRKKNELFRKAVKEIGEFPYSRGEIRHKTLLTSDPIYILQVGVERDLKRRTREFEIEAVENWPTVIVALNNDPKVQKCLVQERGGFQRTATVVKILEEGFNPLLAHHQLAIAFEPIYEERVFWDLVDRYDGKITQIDFELISPNMSNITGSLRLDLGGLQKSTNTQRTHLQLNSDDSSSLTPTADDPNVKGLVEYSSNGGGDIAIRVRGVRGKIHTARGVNEHSIDELIIENASASELARILGGLMQ